MWEVSPAQPAGLSSIPSPSLSCFPAAGFSCSSGMGDGESPALLAVGFLGIQPLCGDSGMWLLNIPREG